MTVACSRPPLLSIVDVMNDPLLFGRWFSGPTWDAWKIFLKALFGLAMTADEIEVFTRHTGRTLPPSSLFIEAWKIVGRRGGKTRVAALVAVFLACFRNYAAILAPGEVGTVMLIASDRRQARVLMRYVTGLLDGVPMLAQMVVGRTAESITLSNRIVIEIHTASFRAVRGYTIVAAVCDEIAYWRSDDAANPDTEILNALRPAMATVPGALLLCISSPYARRGALWEAHRVHFGKDGDPVLVWQADTRTMNPSVPEHVITAAFEADPAAARSEYGAQFRADLEEYVSVDVVERVVMLGRRYVPPQGHARYRAFCDPAGGSGADAMTLGIAHREGDKAVLDVVAAVTPPFSPEDVVEQFSALLARYGLRRVRDLRARRGDEERDLHHVPAAPELGVDRTARRSAARRATARP